MMFYFVEHVEDVLNIALLAPSAAEQKTVERQGRAATALPEPEPAVVSEPVVRLGGVLRDRAGNETGRRAARFVVECCTAGRTGGAAGRARTI